HPVAVNVFATVSMLARPPPRPWRKTTTGEHVSPVSGAGSAQFAATVPRAGVATSSLSGSPAAFVGSGLKAPVRLSRRLKVVMVVSRTSLISVFGTTAGSTPYFAKAVAAVKSGVFVNGPTVAVAAGWVYGSAPSCVPTARIVCGWNGDAIGTWLRST